MKVQKFGWPKHGLHLAQQRRHATPELGRARGRHESAPGAHEQWVSGCSAEARQ